MSWVSRAKHLYLRFSKSGKVESELDEEIQSYFDTMVERRMARGLSRQEAERASRLEFDGPHQVKEKVREARVGAALETILHDIRYASRSMRHSLVFTLTAVLSLALGIGANTAIFSLMDALLLRSLPVREPQELMQLQALSQRRPPLDSFSNAEVHALASRTEIFSGIAAYTSSGRLHVGTPETAEPTAGAWVNGGFYQALGLAPEAGRLLTPEDDQRGAPPVAVITDTYWKRRFQRDSRLIGQTILVEGVPVTVVGVTPPGFSGATVGEAADLTMPVAAMAQ